MYINTKKVKTKGGDIRKMMKKVIAIGIVVIGLLTVMSVLPVAGEIIWDETPQVPVDYYVEYSAIIDEWTEITVSITTDGNPVDVFLLESADHDGYVSFMNEEREDFHYYVDGSATSVVQKAYSFTIPHTDRWYIVIDNALTEISGEAYAGVPVNVHVRVTGEPEAPGFEAIFAIAGIIGVAYLIRQRRK